MTPIEALTGIAVSRIIQSAIRLTETLLGPPIKARAEILVIEANERATAAADERRRAALAQQHLAAEVEAQRQRAEKRFAFLAGRYPLGWPGRVRDGLQQGVAPCLLVSPTDAVMTNGDPLSVANRTHDVIDQIDGADVFLRLVTGAFDESNGAARSVRGNVSAAEIALFEFAPRPSIIVYFTPSGATVTAHALVSNLIRTVDGDEVFETPIARLDGNHLRFAIWNEPSPGNTAYCWTNEPIAGDPVQALGTAIAMVAMAMGAVYWRAQGVRWRLNGPLLAPVNGMFHAAEELAPNTNAAALAERMNQEFADLTAAGADVEVLEWNDDDAVALYVTRPAGAVMFLVGHDYPQSPPIVLARNGEEPVREIVLNESHWQPSHSLTDLLEAL